MVTFHLDLRLLPTFRGRKNRFFFHLTKLITNIQPNVTIKKFKKSLQAPELFRKTYFHMKVIKSGRCHNVGPGQIPWGEFLRQPLMFGLDFHAISIYCLHRTLYKIHKWKLFVYLSLGNNKSGRKSLVEKKAKIIQCAFIIKKKISRRFEASAALSSADDSI